MIHHLVYASKAVKAFDKLGLKEILDTSIKNNSEHNISGFLIYQEGIFLQLLEGDERDVKRIYQNIKEDRRHTMTEVYIEIKSEARIFGDWSMAIHQLEDFHPEKREQVAEVFNEVISTHGGLTSETVYEFLLRFRYYWI